MPSSQDSKKRKSSSPDKSDDSYEEGGLSSVVTFGAGSRPASWGRERRQGASGDSERHHRDLMERERQRLKQKQVERKHAQEQVREEERRRKREGGSRDRRREGQRDPTRSPVVRRRQNFAPPPHRQRDTQHTSYRGGKERPRDSFPRDTRDPQRQRKRDRRQNREETTPERRERKRRAKEAGRDGEKRRKRSPTSSREGSPGRTVVEEKKEPVNQHDTLEYEDDVVLEEAGDEYDFEEVTAEKAAVKSKEESEHEGEEGEVELEGRHSLIPERSRFESSPSESSSSEEEGRVDSESPSPRRNRMDASPDDKGSDSDTKQRAPPRPRPKHRQEFSSGEEISSDSADDSNVENQGRQRLDTAEGETGDYPSPENTTVSKPAYYPAIQGCRSVDEFFPLNRIEEGTYGVVFRARDKNTNEIVALKRLKMEKEKDGFPITALREINTLMKAQHKNIVTVREVVVGSNMDKIYVVMDFVEHDLKSLMETMKHPFKIGEVKCILHQLLCAVAHLHDNWILHRDIKTSNILLSHEGIIKVADFGLAREYGSPLKNYTEIVVTLWYRAPELLMGTRSYSCPIDLWSVGCIFGELLLKKALFPGKSEIDELNIIFRDLGTPNEKIWPGVSEMPAMKKCSFRDYPYNQLRKRFPKDTSLLSDVGFDLLNKFLTYCPNKRINADMALKHAYFSESPRAIEPSMFPTWPARSEGHPHKKVASPRPPSGGKAAGRVMQEDDDRFNFSGASNQPPSYGFNLHF